MSQLVVLTFEDTEQAGQLLESLKHLQSSGNLKIDDAAVVVKEESGKVHVKNQADTGVKWGAVGGSMVGLLLASVFFPIAGIVIGALGGALIGKSMNMGVDQKFVKDVTEAMKPGTSALFVIGSSDPAAFASALRPYKGTVYQTTLPSETVKVLQDELKKKE
jgi:uncharacterized membrane protein